MAPILSDNLKKLSFCHNNKNKIKFYLCISYYANRKYRIDEKYISCGPFGCCFLIG